jgi:predicted lipoprotein
VSASATTGRDGTPARRRLTPRVIGIALTVLVVAAIALDTTYRDADAPRATASGRPAFDRDTYGRETFPRIAQAIEQQATPLPRLLAALREDPEAAGERFGHREGNAPYSFPARGEGVAGAVENGVRPLTVKGVPAGTAVAIQTGPAVPGTAVRDATGEISFGQFVNQVEFADAATALNNEVKAQVLEGLDPARLEGRRVRFVGAFTYLALAAVTITPVQLEPAS